MPVYWNGLIAKSKSHSSFFLNDVCQIANLPKLLVLVKRLLPESVIAYIFGFMNEIFQLLMYKYIHKLTHHTKTPKIVWTKQFLTITNEGLLNCKLGKAFTKTILKTMRARNSRYKPDRHVVTGAASSGLLDVLSTRLFQFKLCKIPSKVN